MDRAQQEQKEFLQQHLDWAEEQIHILDKMNEKLYEMKRIAEYVIKLGLSPIEIDKMNGELQILKIEFSFLEKQLYPVVH